jgi:Domain of unknown function (DUF6531)
LTDYESADPNKLRFVRYYNSEAQSVSMMGAGWRSNYDRSIYFVANPSSTTLLYVVRPDGADSSSPNPTASGHRRTAMSMGR